MTTGEGTYFYCFARTHAGSDLISPGIDGRSQVTAIRWKNLAAVCSQAAIAELSAVGAADREPDPEWLIPRACRHEAVIAEVMRRSPALPVRFGALFSSPSALRTVMERQAAQIDF